MADEVFASADDVAELRPLTDAQRTAAEAAIRATTGLIAEAVGKTQDWVAELVAEDAVPTTLQQLCIQKAIGLVANPEGLASMSKTLGAFSSSRTFPRSADIGIFLSDAELARVRRAVYGLGRTQARQASIVDDVLDISGAGVPLDSE